MLRWRRRYRRRGELLLRGRGERRVEWLLRRRRWASVVLLRSCGATGRWRLGGSRGHGRRSLGVGGRRCGRVGSTDGRLGAVRWSISWTSWGRRSRGDLHPRHLVRDLLHCGWRPIVLRIGGVRPRHVHSSRVVWLRHRRPGLCLRHRWGSILHVPLTVTVLIILLRR